MFCTLKLARVVNPAIEPTPCRAARRRCNLDGQNNVFEGISSKDLKAKPREKRQMKITTDALMLMMIHAEPYGELTQAHPGPMDVISM